jgi:phosphatidylglycerol:prolipoprotein diacylglycerol transferase
MLPELIHIGSFAVPTYGVLVAVGLILGLYVAARLGQHEGMDRDTLFNFGVYLALAGILGSKAALLIQERERYWSNPGQLFSLSTLQSGGIFYGGLILAILFAIWYTHRYRLSFLKLGDVFAPGVAIGHSLGRLGCFAAGCCWGEPTSQPWGVTFTDPHAHETVGVPLNVALHPTQLYEAAADLAIFLFLYSQFRKKQFDGQILGWYLFLYSIARFVIEIFRSHEIDAVLWQGGLSAAQGISVVLFGIGVWLLWFRPHHRQQPSPARS